MQTVGVQPRLAKAGSPTYQKWHERCSTSATASAPPHGAIWLTLYPNIMVEWYPHVLVVSTLYPHGPQKTHNVVEFYYPEEIALFEREFVEAEQAAYMETCVEDDEIALRMDAGPPRLMERGDNEVGPYQIADGRRHAAFPRVVPGHEFSLSDEFNIFTTARQCMEIPRLARSNNRSDRDRDIGRKNASIRHTDFRRELAQHAL